MILLIWWTGIWAGPVAAPPAGAAGDMLIQIEPATGSGITITPPTMLGD